MVSQVELVCTNHQEFRIQRTSPNLSEVRAQATATRIQDCLNALYSGPDRGWLAASTLEVPAAFFGPGLGPSSPIVGSPDATVVGATRAQARVGTADWNARARSPTSARLARSRRNSVEPQFIFISLPTFLPARALAGGGQRPIHGLGPACESKIRTIEQRNPVASRGAFGFARRELHVAAVIRNECHRTPESIAPWEVERKRAAV
jgi:hypothetical protein